MQNACAPSPVILGRLHLEHVADEVLTGEVIGRIEALGQKSDAPARRGHAMRDAENLNAAAVRVAKIEQAFEQSGFAGTVNADQAEELPARDLERDLAQRSRTAVVLGDA